MSKRKRLGGKERRDEILKAALKVSARVGFNNIERADVARVAKCSEALVSSYFGTMQQLKKSVMRAAVVQENLIIIAQGLAIKNPHALKAPPEIRSAAAQSLAGV